MSLFRKKKRILFAAVDVGFRIEHYSKFIAKEFNEELEAESFSKYIVPTTHFETSYTYSCPIDKTHPLKLYAYCSWFFIRALFRYDVFHFISGETILTRKLRRFELMTYRLFGKKVIMHFVGSDIRSEIYLEEKNDHLEDYLNGQYQIKSPISEPFQLKLLADTRKYAHHILVSTPDLLEIAPEGIFVPVFLDLEKHPSVPKKTTSLPIKILHSPSGFNTKGSNYIHEILHELELNYGDRIELTTPGKKLTKGKSYALTRYDLLETMQKSDIVIDQMLIGWYGLKAVEALNFGCEVFCFITPSLMKYMDSSNPIHPASIIDLKQNLMNVIDHLIQFPDASDRSAEKIKFIQEQHNLASKKELHRKIWLI